MLKILIMLPQLIQQLLNTNQKSGFFNKLTDDDNGVFKNVKMTVPLKYLSNIWG